MKRMSTVAAVWFCFIAATGQAAPKQHHSTKTNGQFDYYLLSLSWAPNYCAGHPKDHSVECRAGRHANFVLHGLWPQMATGQQRTNCTTASPVSSATVQHMRQYYPSSSLIQHEWSTHGTCSGLSAADYFGQVEQAFTAIKIPDQYRNLGQSQTLDVKDIEQGFAAANNAPTGAFRISCHSGELVNVEVCLSKDLQYQACTASARECPSAQVLMRPVN
jgi:ribonuclease T2